MSEEELRRVLQDITADKDRRATDRESERQREATQTRFMAIAAYTGIAALVGGIILWASDARTREITNPIVKDQAIMQSEIKSQKENTDELKQTMKEGFSEIKALLKK